MEHGNEPYNYEKAGFNSFLTRSIDDIPASNLDDFSAAVQTSTREVNYDQSPVTGQLGSALRIGNIQIDGEKGRITIFDNNNEVVWIGNIDG